MIAAGGEICLEELIGEHECAEIPPSLFDFEGRMRKGNISTLLKVILEDTHIKCLDALPNETISTAVIVDAMYSNHKWSFRPSEKFKDVEQRYRDTLLRDVPTNTSSIHFCCDRYDQVPSLKAMEKTRRGKSELQKLYDIQNHLSVPAFRDFVLAVENKAALSSFLSSSWSSPGASSPVTLYLSGGFTEKSKTMVVDEKGARDITTLGSTHEEADNRITLHAIYSAEELGANRIVIHSNDTDVVILAIYYCVVSTSLTNVWVRTDPETFIPISDIVRSLGKDKCILLPFFHAFSGKDNTSFFYGLGKKKLWKCLGQIPLNPLKLFAEDMQSQIVSDELIQSCQSLVVRASGGTEESLVELRTQKFLTAKSGLLLSLPPTEDALLQHIKRSAVATIISKSSHIAKPKVVDFTSYGWSLQKKLCSTYSSLHDQKSTPS